MSSTPNLMKTSKGAKTLAHTRILLVHDIISTASNKTTIVQDIVTFAHDITICVHHIKYELQPL